MRENNALSCIYTEQTLMNPMTIINDYGRDVYNRRGTRRLYTRLNNVRIVINYYIFPDEKHNATIIILPSARLNVIHCRL